MTLKLWKPWSWLMDGMDPIAMELSSGWSVGPRNGSCLCRKNIAPTPQLYPEVSTRSYAIPLRISLWLSDGNKRHDRLF